MAKNKYEAFVAELKACKNRTEREAVLKEHGVETRKRGNHTELDEALIAVVGSNGGVSSRKAFALLGAEGVERGLVASRLIAMTKGKTPRLSYNKDLGEYSVPQ